MSSVASGVRPRTAPPTRTSAPAGSEAIETSAHAGTSLGSNVCNRPSPSTCTSAVASR